MASKGISKEHLEFIRLVSIGHSLEDAYVTSSNTNTTGGNSRTQGSRLGKKYAIEIAHAKDKAVKLVNDVNDSEVVKNAIKDILTQAEVDAHLCRIMTKAKYDGDKLKAIDLYNKRFGSNAPVKSDVKILDMPAPIIRKSAE